MYEKLAGIWNRLQSDQVERWLFFANLSFFTNIIMAIGKILLGLYTTSIFLCIHSIYNAGMAMARIVAVRGHKKSLLPPDRMHPNGYGRKEYQSYFHVGFTLTVTSLVYVIYCLRLFIQGDSSQYSQIQALAIAVVTFAEIGIAIYGIVATRKYKTPTISAIKLASFTSALISLVLTQTALLSFQHDTEMSFYNGLLGSLVGVVCAFIGIGMMLYISRILNGRYAVTVQKKLECLIRKNGHSIRIEPLKYEDDGPKARFLYVKIIGDISEAELAAIKEKIETKNHTVLIEQ